MDLTCHICHVKKNSRQMLTLHIQADHEGIRYNCKEEGCNYSSKQKAQLKNHINIKHLGIKVQCELCDYKTTQVPNLNNHMLKKHGVKAAARPNVRVSLHQKSLGYSTACRTQRHRRCHRRANLSARYRYGVVQVVCRPRCATVSNLRWTSLTIFPFLSVGGAGV